MNKVFEALENLFDLVRSQDSFEKAQKCYDILEEAITELQAIKEAKPSEALEDLDKMAKKVFLVDDDDFEFYYNKVEQALLKAQQQKNENEELKEVLMLIKEKKVDLDVVAISDGYAMYNAKMADRHPNIAFKDFGLTKEQFDIVKRWSEK